MRRSLALGGFCPHCGNPLRRFRRAAKVAVVAIEPHPAPFSPTGKGPMEREERRRREALISETPPE